MILSESTISSPDDYHKTPKKIKVKHESTDGGSSLFQSSPKKAPKMTFSS